MTMWEANNRGYKPYTLWFPEMLWWCPKLAGLWTDIWSRSANNGDCIIVQMEEV